MLKISLQQFINAEESGGLYKPPLSRN